MFLEAAFISLLFSTEMRKTSYLLRLNKVASRYFKRQNHHDYSKMCVQVSRRGIPRSSEVINKQTFKAV